jgi:hypothetical protein
VGVGVFFFSLSLLVPEVEGREIVGRAEAEVMLRHDGRRVERAKRRGVG